MKPTKLDEKKQELAEWLNNCPLPVIGRVIPDKESLSFLGTTTHVYEDDMLVVVPIKLLNTLESS